MMMMETMSNKFGPKLRYCPGCHQVWELELPSNKKIVHKDFPSYGLPRDVCFDCKEAYTNQNCQAELNLGLVSEEGLSRLAYI